jgi:hypothetical protein
VWKGWGWEVGDQEAKQEPFSTPLVRWGFQRGLSSQSGPQRLRFAIPKSEQDGWSGRSGDTLPTGFWPSPPAAPCVPARTFLATRSSCHASSFPNPAALPQPVGCPRPSAAAPPAPAGDVRVARASRGLYLARGGREVVAEAPALELEPGLGWRGRARDATAAGPPSS